MFGTYIGTFRLKCGFCVDGAVEALEVALVLRLVPLLGVRAAPRVEPPTNSARPASTTGLSASLSK